MKVGIHLPQFGRAAGPESIRRAAVAAERLGFADVWISDHIVRPEGQTYPSAYLFDPLLTLTWAAAATERIGLGTSVIVAPQYSPVWLANALASLDALSSGRLTVGLGVGWSQAEFVALGQSFHDRGARTDEIIEFLRVAWGPDPVEFHGTHIDVEPLRLQPKPADRIALWVGGSGEPAYRRAARLADGFHAIGLDPTQAAATVARIRRDRPEPEFVVSLRTGWDPQGMDPARIREERLAFAEAGIGHVISAPWRDSADDWLRSMEMLAEICELDGH